MTPSSSLKKPLVKVCVHADCCARGSERVYERLVGECSSDADVRKTEDCFRFCKIGPNVAVRGNVLHHMNERSAVSRVQSELRRPSARTDGVGTRTIDELDEVLDDLFL